MELSRARTAELTESSKPVRAVHGRLASKAGGRNDKETTSEPSHVTPNQAGPPPPQGADSVLNMNHHNLGALSAHAMGTLLQGNMLLSSLSLDHNVFGAGGIQAIAEGLGEAPIKSLHIKSTGLQGTEDEAIKEL